MTTTTIARGSDWSDENLKSSWGEIDAAYDHKAVERKLSEMVTKRFAELTPDSVSWIPYTSEVIGDVTEDYSDIDLDVLRQQAQDEIYQQWTNGDIDIDDCLINDRKSANAYQIQFKDYDVWIDFLDTQDGHDGLYKTNDEASDKISDLKERFPSTEFCYEEREPGKELTEEEKVALFQNILRRIIPAYYEDGTLVDEYYKNIVLPDLTEQQYNTLKYYAGE